MFVNYEFLGWLQVLFFLVWLSSIYCFLFYFFDSLILRGRLFVLFWTVIHFGLLSDMYEFFGVSTIHSDQLISSVLLGCEIVQFTRLST
jgi:hypothetical protein